MDDFKRMYELGMGRSLVMKSQQQMDEEAREMEDPHYFKKLREKREASHERMLDRMALITAAYVGRHRFDEDVSE